MKQFRQFLTEEIASETRQVTNFLVDSIYSEYVKKFNKNDVSCVGWLDGTENAEVRFRKIYEGGISDKDSVLDVGCGVAHLHTYLKNQGWNGQYFGFDPNKAAIDLIGEEIEAIHGTIEDIDKTKTWDWAVACLLYTSPRPRD